MAAKEPDEAIAAHLEILDRDGTDRRALAELSRLYREGGRHADLLDVLERQAQLDNTADRQVETEASSTRSTPLRLRNSAPTMIAARIGSR